MFPKAFLLSLWWRVDCLQQWAKFADNGRQVVLQNQFVQRGIAALAFRCLQACLWYFFVFFSSNFVFFKFFQEGQHKVGAEVLMRKELLRPSCRNCGKWKVSKATCIRAWSSFDGSEKPHFLLRDFDRVSKCCWPSDVGHLLDVLNWARDRTTFASSSKWVWPCQNVLNKEID